MKILVQSTYFSFLQRNVCCDHFSTNRYISLTEECIQLNTAFTAIGNCLERGLESWWPNIAQDIWMFTNPAKYWHMLRLESQASISTLQGEDDYLFLLLSLFFFSLFSSFFSFTLSFTSSFFSEFFGVFGVLGVPLLLLDSLVLPLENVKMINQNYE